MVPSWAAAPARPPALGIEELCQKREELCRQIQQDEDEKQRLQNEVKQLTEKLARVNENLARKIASRNEFDRTIAETEAAYLKVGPRAAGRPTWSSPRGFWPGGASGRGDRTTGEMGAAHGARCVLGPIPRTVLVTVWLVLGSLAWLPRMRGRGRGSSHRLRWHVRGLGCGGCLTEEVTTALGLCSQILESSQTLLSVLKREAGNLTKATASEQKSSGGKDG